MASATRPEPPREVWTSEKGSMARETATTRWPKIVQNMVDDLEESFGQSDKEHVEEGRRIQATLRIIKGEIMQDNQLHPLSSDGCPDIQTYNAQLQSFGNITWHNCPWLFAECYLYRCVQTLFARSQFWRDYDIFARQKLSAFVASHTAVQELSERYVSLTEATGALTIAKATDDAETERLFFSEMTEMALWGNVTDLSLLSALTNNSLDHLRSLQGSAAIREGQARIVSNDVPAAWDHLRSRRGAPQRRVDVVLDNAGFELLTDLVYALYLLDAGLASAVKLHVKAMPWFVSDVTPRDIDVLLSALADPTVFPGASNLSVQELVRRMRACCESGIVSVAEHAFWTTGFDFQALPEVAPELHRDLLDSSLVVFKGDLNYRKLVRDAMAAYNAVQGRYWAAARGVEDSGIEDE
ncbi:hypothetical protein CHGG_02134 [Chaetomium globosum CBS 148.51]|uniref:Sugar phosphate phosphatase n=1 Tax=Chaetomium globosum (strain ATCC 6205 / CBS 148.51 / DSM 1962 / NBRC 6347 / NRRL 1970) TaxID=306901 RepID=Q2HCC0_CHAGB|nr:uncharacterized protein CHGG_02134 [Chaetomium globosum CBS 148.51]EAQ93899.1 hypothetical protein CHGG_02134 [Chaetomium globosum CBS 148.51]